ncbi:MAG: hypothetical protein M5U07_13935 [Xanthobacteraceae bacterium]|nr:hypothetical protein [Xanthobacteraceae bacterium]
MSTSTPDAVGEIGANRIVEQLIEADDAHQAETERQADRQQEVDAAEAESEDDA